VKIYRKRRQTFSTGLGVSNKPAFLQLVSIILDKVFFHSRLERTQRTNPEIYLHKDIPLPAFFIQHGNIDSLFPVQQSIRFHERLKEFLPREKLYFEILDGAEHGDPKFTTEQNLNKVFNFISRFM
jgi:hypothetical protein